MNRIHFHTFDAFRFVAFFLVFLHHLPINETSFFYFFAKSGGIGVSFFFVLSGFLITYILMHEKKQQGRISLKNFFTRRILRIWPLFYAMILFAFLTPFFIQFLNLPYSNEGYHPNWLISSLFLENYKMMITDSFPNVSPLRVMWTLCIEEHFYFIWGLALFFIPIKRIPVLIFLSLVLANTFKVVYHSYDVNPIDIFSNIDYFAYGAIPAYLLIQKDEILKRVTQIPIGVKYATLLLALILVFAMPHYPYNLQFIINPALLGILFSLSILFTLTQTKGIKIGDLNPMSQLGIYTYGLYLYHTIVINLMLQLMKNSFFENKIYIVGIASFVLTVLVSVVSYHVFEKRFIGLKRYFYKND